MKTSHEAEARRTSAVLIYVVLILTLQVFLLVVALEALMADEESIAWPAALLSVGGFSTSLSFAWLLRRR